MKKAAVIGSSALGINAADGIPASMSPEGRMLHTSVHLARNGVSVTFVSEAARDRVGDFIVDYLAAHGVATSSIDRYAGGIRRSISIFSLTAHMECLIRCATVSIRMICLMPCGRASTVTTSW